MTDTAWTNAGQKLKGVTIEAAKKHYDEVLAAYPQTRVMAQHIVDKVYSDTFQNAWSYAVTFYEDCAKNIADVPANRTSLATYCMQNAMIGMTTQSYKDAGLPVQKAYDYFAKFTAPTVKSIIDKVYAESKTRSDAGMEEWKICMEPLMGRLPSRAAVAGSIMPFVPFADGKIQGLPISRSNVAAPFFLGSAEEQKKIVDGFVADNSKADSVALYVAANTAIKIGDVKDAGFLFYAAQIRKQFDYKRYGLSEGKRREIQAYWEFLNQPIGEDVNPAITRRPQDFSDVVDRIVKWQVVPADEALYDTKLYGALVLPKDQWQVVGDAEKKNFLDNFGNKQKAFLSNPQNVEALIFVQDYNFGKIPHTPENSQKYDKYLAIMKKARNP
jgi:hypothetical protein